MKTGGDPASAGRRFVTTIIHFDRFVPDPREVLRSPFFFPWASDRFHAAMLEKTMGGFYPMAGQLEACARSYFELINNVDGTEDYRRTSEEWLARARRGGELPQFSHSPARRTETGRTNASASPTGDRLCGMWVVDRAAI